MPRRQRTQAEVDALMSRPHKAGANDAATVKASMTAAEKRKASRKKAKPNGLAARAAALMNSRRNQMDRQEQGKVGKQ